MNIDEYRYIHQKAKLLKFESNLAIVGGPSCTKIMNNIRSYLLHSIVVNSLFMAVLLGNQQF